MCRAAPGAAGRAASRAARAAAAVAAPALVAAVLATAATPAGAQPAPTARGGLRIDVRDVAPVTIAGPSDERLRLGQLLGTDSASGYLLRSMSTLTPELGRDPVPRGGVLYLLRPEARLTNNSALPTPANDGALWASRGTSFLVRGGIAVRSGVVTAILAPELTVSQNRGYFIFPTTTIPGRNPFANPLFAQPYSADLPQRFGDEAVVAMTLGQTALYATFGAVSVGGSTENVWWGPGRHDALLLSNAAEGFPHLFVRTARPLRTFIGDVEAQLVAGGLTESLYFDLDPENDQRSLSGIAATLRPRGASGLTVGVSRMVVAPASGAGDVFGNALDAIIEWENLGPGPGLDTLTRSHDQLLSLFGRWLMPRGGVELYGEWARLEPPRSFRDLLIAPHNTQAWMLGATKAFALARGDAVQAQVEFTNLEQTTALTDRPPSPDYYTGRAAPQGFSHRGQVLGATIGPGSSSQLLGVDYFSARWQAGAFVRRVRWQNDALYRQFLANNLRHDVSIAGGLRGAYRFSKLDARVEIGLADRVNYLYQNGSTSLQGKGTVDVHNLTLSIDLSPRTARSPRGVPAARATRGAAAAP